MNDATRSIPGSESLAIARKRGIQIPDSIGRYRILSLLGRGGMGDVYLGFDMQLGRKVAIKVLPEQPSLQQNARKRFLREAQASAALSHPAICTIYSIEQEGPLLFLVLEHVMGRTFRDLLDEPAPGWPLPPKIAAAYASQIADALSAAHAAGIIHRDIKSANLMLTPDGRIKILDFGLAKAQGSRMLTEEGVMLGTPAYSSPEQTRAETLDSRTDLWSLGVVFYEILTGKLPFDEINSAALAQAILQREPVPLRQLRPDISAPLARIVHRLLIKNREQRYLSARALIDDLRLHTGGDTESTSGLQTSQAAVAAQPRSGLDSRLGTSERRTITFLNIELLAKTLDGDPEAFESALEESRDICVKVLARFEGYLQPWAGNSATAYFGYPQAREDAARLAVEAALAIGDAFSGANSRFSAKMGVETSLAVTDMSGAKPVSGEGFETARVLGQRSELNEVLVGQEVRRLTEGHFAFGPQQEATLSGGRIMRYSAAVHASTARSRFQVIPEAELTPFVGRDQELQWLLGKWQSAKQGEGHVTLLSSASGLGKSRLIYEIKRRVAQDPSAALIECFCAPQYANTAWYPLVDCIERLVFESESRTLAPHQKLRRLEVTVAELGFPLAETLPIFAELMGVHARGYAALELTPEKLRLVTLDILANTVIERAARQPLLFVVEDLQWADPTTLEFLRLVMERSAAAPLLVVYTYRPEYAPSWQQRSHVSTLSLGRLSPADSRTVAQAASRAARVDSATLEQIVDQSDGVPLFLEEITKMMAEAGATAAASNKLTVPATLRDSFIARLDQLGNARNVARMASILGREFPESLLEAASELPPEELRQSLDRLVEAEILHIRGTGARRTYVFKHALLQEAAYDSLLRKSRLTLHGQIAQLLLERFPETAARQPEVVARHFTEAGQGEEAIPYWHKAGRAALRRSAYAEALSHLRHGLEVYRNLSAERQNPQQELLLLTTMGPALVTKLGFGAEEVGETYRRAEQLLPPGGNSPLLLPALWGVWVYSLVRSDLPRAAAISRRMVESGEEHGADGMRLEGLWTTGNTLFWMGDLAGARKHHEAAELLYDAERFGDHALHFGQDTLVGTLCYLSFVYCFLGFFGHARTASDRSLAVARKLRRPFSIGWALAFRATLNCFFGNNALAQQYGVEAVRYCQEQEYPFWMSAALSAAGKALAELGEFEAGIARLREGITMTHAIGSRVIEPLFRGQLAEALLRAGDPKAGLAEAEGGLQQAEQQGVGISRLDLLRIRAVALAKNGRRAEAEEALRFALSESQAAGSRYVELLTATDLAGLCEDRGPLEAICATLADETGEVGILERARQILRKR